MSEAAAAPSTSTGLTARQIWQRSRGLLLGLAIVLVAGIVMAALRSGDHHGRLDPRSSDPQGSLAVAELLKDRGVTTQVVTTLDSAAAAVGRPGTTLLVTTPDLLTARQQRDLRAATERTSSRTVLVAPGAPSVSTLAPGVRAGRRTAVSPRSPQCSLPAALRAVDVESGGLRYTTDVPGADACYRSNGQPTVLRLPAPAGGDTVVLGAPDILHNDRLDKQGNASLALQLLGSRPHLVWYLPSLTDASATEGGESSFVDLVPPGWLWATLQLALAAGLAAVWRARRLGPLVTEHLPVAVRASETTEGRARLYRRANARERASSALRSATRIRLAPLLGVPAYRAHASDALLPAVSTHLPMTSRDFSALLFGTAPSDDAGLIRLADELDALEREVRAS
ncbi:DUF4350 domain-containing protein [Streptomyces hypolithicus]